MSPKSCVHILVFTLAVLIPLLTTVQGHGVLERPYGRRRGPHKLHEVNWMNYYFCGDNGKSFGGGLYQEYNQSKWACGVCGDKLGETENEYNGTNWLSFPGPKAAYVEGSVITLRFTIYDPHYGYVECRICNDSRREQNNQDCFNSYLLHFKPKAENNFWKLTDTRAYLKVHETPGYGIMLDVETQLPNGLVCDYCVLQFHYRAGRNKTLGELERCTLSNNDTPKRIDDGLSKQVCRIQETFRSCADFRILPKNRNAEAIRNIYFNDMCIGLSGKSNDPFVQLNLCDSETTQNPKYRIAGLQPWKNYNATPAALVFPNSDACIYANSYTDPMTSIIYECNFGIEELWTFIYQGDNKFRIRSEATHKCLTGTDQGWDSIILLPCNDPSVEQDTQLWEITPKPIGSTLFH